MSNGGSTNSMNGNGYGNRRVRWAGASLTAGLAVAALIVQWGVVTTKLDQVESRSGTPVGDLLAQPHNTDPRFAWIPHVRDGTSAATGTESATLFVMGSQRASSDDLFVVTYDELRDLAARLVRHENPVRAPGATSLVHQAYEKIAGETYAEARWEHRGRFLGAAAQAMRRILIDRARAHAAAKRGGGGSPWPLSAVATTLMSRDDTSPDLDRELLGRV